LSFDGLSQLVRQFQGHRGFPFNVKTHGTS
jgi:hypothetical protein